MKFKVRKIRNIDKKVCCCEQKIAYNYAFSYSDILKKAKKKCFTAIQFDEILQETIDMIIKDCKRNETDKKYNLDVIIIAYRNAIHNDYLNGFEILTSYEEIGKIFSVPYEIE